MSHHFYYLWRQPEQDWPTKMSKAGKIRLFLLTASLLLLFSSFRLQVFIEKISMDFGVQSLKDGQSVSMKGEIYYSSKGSKMVTHFSSPIDQLIITNSGGEFKSYDSKQNTVVMDEGKDYSSKVSFVYFFINGQIQDMGLNGLGYMLKDTRIEDKTVITTWQPRPDMGGLSARVELVHENRQPIYMCFYNAKKKPQQKIYYSDYQKIGNFSFPMKITEFEYLPSGDSVITRRKYSNPHLNAEVPENYLNFKIPDNAKVVRQH